MGKYNLPVAYHDLEWWERREVREQYVSEQSQLCMFCGVDLYTRPKQTRRINWKLFPPNFLKHPIHLQHCHKTGLTEGAVHAYCNAVMWQYYGR